MSIIHPLSRWLHASKHRAEPRFLAEDDEAPRDSRPPGSEGALLRTVLAVLVFLATVYLYSLHRG